MTNLDSGSIEALFVAFGQHLAEHGQSAAFVVVGGVALALRGFVERTTTDVDVIAQATEEGGTWTLTAPEPLSDAIQAAVARVGRDHGLPSDWLNADVGAQWRFGLPEWLGEELEWRRYGPLAVGIAGRRALIALKLFATVDHGPGSVHEQDLIALAPSESELAEAADWVRLQDAGWKFSDQVEQVVEHLRGHLGRG